MRGCGLLFMAREEHPALFCSLQRGADTVRKQWLGTHPMLSTALALYRIASASSRSRPRVARGCGVSRGTSAQ
jgi:hypothetical protein